MRYGGYNMGTNRVKIKKILLAMDGSGSSVRASKYAMHLAKLDNAEITLLHVLEDIRQGGATDLLISGNDRLAKSFLKDSEEAARRWMTRVEKEAERNRVKLSTKILIDQSSKAKGILNFAEKNKVDIVIMGTRGLTRFKKLVIGSVANAVLGNAKCPVLIVK